MAGRPVRAFPFGVLPSRRRRSPEQAVDVGQVIFGDRGHGVGVDGARFFEGLGRTLQMGRFGA